MQTQFFSFLDARFIDQVVVDAAQRLPAPVELDLAALEHIGGGLGGPAGTWSTGSAAMGPAGTW